MTAPENNPELARKERRKEAIRHDITYIKEELHTLRSTPRLYDFYQGNIKFAPTLITEGEKRV
ncbi:MAG: hypothetical protein LBO09_05305 [Candidatus Peribacteria bacterium]|jgi:hypothetical protein|nr:hypothetical protein [Candidatus Peribacteria bacterium]